MFEAFIHVYCVLNLSTNQKVEPYLCRMQIIAFEFEKDLTHQLNVSPTSQNRFKSIYLYY